MKTIALEEHFVTANLLKATGAYGTAPPPRFRQMQAQLLDLGAGRIAAMDEAGIDLQVLSTTTLVGTLQAATASAVLHDANDELAAAVRAYPGRFAGFASLNTRDPEAAAKEFERCVNRLGFKGALFSGTTDGEFLDQPKFTPIFEAANAMRVPIYIHPAPPPDVVKIAYFSGLPGETGLVLSIAGWGWHAETGLHSLRLIVSGLFDRFPELQVIIGHMGEGVPYALARSNQLLTGVARHLKLSVAEYFHRNFHVTTSGYFTLPPFQCAYEVVGIDRLMYSVDYPFSTNMQGRDFLDSLKLNDDDKSKLTHGNAEALLKL
ncbi:MAG: amidohydrolase family protein [Candidatus Sulfotelmatobacter sp.]|jgi:predicted TIM-barrel fold metal-dependent hydrolase